jgi:hypothetical protein
MKKNVDNQANIYDYLEEDDKKKDKKKVERMNHARKVRDEQAKKKKEFNKNQKNKTLEEKEKALPSDSDSEPEEDYYDSGDEFKSTVLKMMSDMNEKVETLYKYKEEKVAKKKTRNVIDEPTIATAKPKRTKNESDSEDDNDKKKRKPEQQQIIYRY